MPSLSALAYFNSVKFKFIFFSSRLLCIFLILSYAIASFVIFLCYEVSVLKFRGLSNTPKLSPIYERHQQPDLPEVSSLQSGVVCGVENVGKRTTSDRIKGESF